MKNKFFDLIRAKKESASGDGAPGSDFSYGGLTDVGLRRSDNQDSYGIFPEKYIPAAHPKGQLFLVADGMGGLLGGRQASEMAVNTIRQVFFENHTPDIPQSLQKAFESANTGIYDAASRVELEHRMGTTCSALVLTEGLGYIAHVGDSRIYRIRDHSLEQLTIDHTEVAELIRHDLLSPEDAQTHPRKSILSRALGIEDSVNIDIIPEIDILSGDRFVLCTDGLAKATPEEIQKIVLSSPPQEACAALVELANQKGGADNVTALVISASADRGRSPI